MAYPTAVGVNSLSPALINEIWNAKYQVKFYPRTCLDEISTTEGVEGTITKQGDTVHINILPDLDVFDHVIGMELPESNPVPITIDFKVDKGVGFNFHQDPVNIKQSIIKWAEAYATDAVKQTKIYIERGFFTAIYPEAHASNKGATAGYESGNLDFGASGAPVEITSDNVLRKLLEMDQAMDELNIAEDERFKVIPAWMATLLKDSDLKNASLMGNGESLIIKGIIGKINNSTIIRSNLLPKVTDSTGAACTHVIGGHKSACAFVTQLLINEEVTTSKKYGKYRRGLTVYGQKVVRPAGLVDLYCTQG
jgi:hypothetical protein